VLGIVLTVLITAGILGLVWGISTLSTRGARSKRPDA
jgi:hypothetical protein